MNFDCLQLLVAFIFPGGVAGDLVKGGKVDAPSHSFSCVLRVPLSYQSRALLWKTRKAVLCLSFFLYVNVQLYWILSCKKKTKQNKKHYISFT